MRVCIITLVSDRRHLLKQAAHSFVLAWGCFGIMYAIKALPQISGGVTELTRQNDLY